MNDSNYYGSTFVRVRLIVVVLSALMLASAAGFFFLQLGFISLLLGCIVAGFILYTQLAKVGKTVVDRQDTSMPEDVISEEREEVKALRRESAQLRKLNLQMGSLEERNAELQSENLKLRAVPHTTDPYYSPKEDVELSIKMGDTSSYLWRSKPLSGSRPKDCIRLIATGSGPFIVGIGLLKKGSEAEVEKELMEKEVCGTWTYHYEVQIEGDHIVYLKGMVDHAVVYLTISARQIRTAAIGQGSTISPRKLENSSDDQISI